MVTDTGKQTPYAALAPVMALIRRRRERSLPDTLNTEKLIQLGISEGNISRVLQTLRFLNLIDEEGHQTEWFSRIARAKEQEYPDILAEIIKGAYHDVFTIIGDPNQVTDVELNDAFRFCQPESQRNRMIILFRGLCQEAGLIAGGPPETHMRARTTTPGKSLPSQPNGAKKALPKSEPSHSFPAVVPHSNHDSTQSDYSILENLIKKLPNTGKWTQARRDKWIKAVEANVDVLIDIVDQEEEEEL